MNFLAHQYLSFDHPGLMVGNFLADTIRGRNFKQYPESIQVGIELHRYIDHFTDGHSQVLESRKLLYPDFGKYAQVVQDIFYDHFLAIRWREFHNMDLPHFAGKVYRTLGAHQAYFNDRAARTFHYMERHNWLANYALEEGIDRSLKGLAHRATFSSGMQEAIPTLRRHRRALDRQFMQFMPQLKNAVFEAFAVRAESLGHSNNAT